MYTPDHFRMAAAGKLAALMQRYSFATLITQDGQASFASHLPLLYRPEAGGHGTLASHMARANPQWKHFAGEPEVLAIFQGPHGYISPSWYVSPQEVPTWNYAVVHVYGIPTIITDHDRFAGLLQETISTYEAPRTKPWPGNLPVEFRDKLMKAIVGFEIKITRIEGKFKLGQNRATADVQGAITALLTSSNPADHELAAAMETELKLRPG